MIYKCSRHDVLAASVINDEVVYLVLDRASSVEDLEPEHSVKGLLIA